MFETVSGALTKINKKSQHAADQKMVLATHRTAETTSKDCNRLYLRKKPKRSTPVKPSEVIQRERFAAISRAVNARAHDINKMSQDQAAFKAQSTYTTMRSYLWALEAEAYDAQQG